jgi:hypothetical protein
MKANDLSVATGNQFCKKGSTYIAKFPCAKI